MLSKMYKSSLLKNHRKLSMLSKMNFGTLTTGFAPELNPTMAKTEYHKHMLKNTEYVKLATAGERKYREDRKEYFDMLNNVDARQKFFAALSEKAPGDIGEVSKVKSKISQMVQREAEEMGFKE